MRKDNAAPRAANPEADPPSAVDDPVFRELLDHLGRLLAQEYVALLKKKETAQQTQR